MDHIPREGLTVTLARQRFLRLRHPAGVQVNARRGTLWITIDGVPDDIELERGESYTFPADASPALIGVLGGEAVASLRSRPAPAAAPAWWRRLAGAA
jgi:hypothetical protein